MFRKRMAFAAGLMVLAAASIYAQRFAESVEVTIVEVPVKVVDRNGEPVRGLTRENFELYDDGKRVPIEYFEVLDLRAAEAGEASGPLPAAATRHFLLLFDLANSSPGNIGRATEAAAQFVDAQLGVHDLAAVAVYTAESGPRMLTSFTRNRVLLDDAIHTLGHPKYFKVADPLMISEVRSSSGATSAGGAARSEAEAAMAETVADFNKTAQTMQDSQMRTRLQAQLANFGKVARTLDRLPGQKQIILLSEGFDARLVQGREDISDEKTRAESDAVLSGEVWNVDNEQRFGSASSSRDVGEMAQLFRRSDVVLHAIDIKGVRSGVDAKEGARRSSNESLTLITAPTGGTVFKNSNDLSTNFARMIKQQEVVYVLGLNARGTGKPGKFHELRVKVNPRAARVAHRSGYYEAGARLTELERTLSLAEVMITDTPLRDVGVTFSATPLPGPGGMARVPVVVEIPGGKLVEGVQGNVATASLYLYAFDAKNEVIDFLQQRISLDLAKTGDALRASGVRYFGSLRLPPGSYAVKALVRVEETGRSGFLRSDIEVPAFDKAVVLPPLFFVEPQNWIMLKAPSRGDDYPYPFGAGDQMYVPRRGGELKKDSDYRLALFLYRMPIENLEVKPELVLADGSTQAANVKLLGRSSADDRGGIKLLFNFSTGTLPAGEHQLRFTVKGKDGTSRVVSVPFQVL